MKCPSVSVWNLLNGRSAINLAAGRWLGAVEPLDEWDEHIVNQLRDAWHGTPGPATAVCVVCGVVVRPGRPTVRQDCLCNECGRRAAVRRG